MSTISLRLPESLQRQSRELAEREGISINQVIANSLAEKMSALMTRDYTDTRAQRRSARAFQRVLESMKATVTGSVRGMRTIGVSSLRRNQSRVR